MDPINESEKNIAALVRDTPESFLSSDEIVELMLDFAFPDPANRWDPSRACATCPPAPARLEFVEKAYQEIKDLYCDHEDSAIPVAEYILAEIQKNSFSNVVEQISSVNMMGGTVPAMELWVMMVNTNRPWDHKPILSKMFEGKGVSRPIRFDSTGKNSVSYYFKYKKQDYYYDVFSNIHYGYVGLKAGFTKGQLLFGSNIQQMIHDTTSLIWPFSGDTKSDQVAMEIGFELHDATGGNPDTLTALDILEALDKSSKLGYKESRQPHWCQHPDNPEPKKLEPQKPKEK